LCNQIEEDLVAGYVAGKEEIRHAHRILIRRLQRKDDLRYLGLVWRIIIKIYLKETKYVITDWMSFAQDGFEWHAAVNTTMKFYVK
jgi:hypothetical protein